MHATHTAHRKKESHHHNSQSSQLETNNNSPIIIWKPTGCSVVDIIASYVAEATAIAQRRSMATTQRKHYLTTSVAPCRAAILVLLIVLSLLGLTSGLLQPSSTVTNRFARIPILLREQSTCLWSASVDDSELVEDPTQSTYYDWDEQFEELQSFMSEYGHCNFPQNPCEELEQNYPMLKRFCHDQRIDYKRLLRNKPYVVGVMRSLRVFDRDVRCGRLEELGFEFNPRSAKWYDSYHELIQYQRENGHLQVTAKDNYSLLLWIGRQRLKQNDEFFASQVKLLDDIGFIWKPETNDELWNKKYQQLVASRNEEGHFHIESGSSLDQWMHHQRLRRRGKKGYPAITEEKIRLLEDVEFPWEPERCDAKWYAMYDELQRFQKKHGHCQPKDQTHPKLYRWSVTQRAKHNKGRLSAEHIVLLEKINFPFEGKHDQRRRMFSELAEYSKTHGHLRVGKDDNPELYDWMAAQRKIMLTDYQVEQLEDLHFCWSLDWRERTWHEKYTEAVEFVKEHGHVRVTKKENPGLYNWMQMQEKRYKEVKGQKPLSEEELEMLEQIDFPFFDDQSRMVWNSMYAELERYREENDGRFPTSRKDDPDLNRWMRQQRRRYRAEYGYVPLSDEQKARLESVDFPMYPTGKRGRQWYEKYEKMVNFWKQHGHFLVDKGEDAVLHGWIEKQRSRFHGVSIQHKPISKMEIYLLERIGFPWVSNRNELHWQKRYEEVVEFLEARDHLPRSSHNPKLAKWVDSSGKDTRAEGNLLSLANPKSSNSKRLVSSMANNNNIIILKIILKHTLAVA